MIFTSITKTILINHFFGTPKTITWFLKTDLPTFTLFIMVAFYECDRRWRRVASIVHSEKNSLLPGQRGQGGLTLLAASAFLASYMPERFEP
jgi:hypothetical protein